MSLSQNIKSSKVKGIVSLCNTVLWADHEKFFKSVLKHRLSSFFDFLWYRTTILSNRTSKAASFVIWLHIKNQGDLSSWKMALDFNNVSWYLNSESLMWSVLITAGRKKQTISVSLEERNAFQIRYCEKIHLCFKWKRKNSGRKK